MSIPDLITWTAIAGTWAALIASWWLDRRRAAARSQDEHARALGREITRLAGRVGGTCVESGAVCEIGGRRLWVTVSNEDVPDEEGDLAAEGAGEASA